MTGATGADPAARRGGVGRRGWLFLATTVLAVCLTGLVLGVVAYAVLAGAAVAAWVTRQHPLIRWTLTVLAGALLVALALGLGGTVQHGSTVGPVVRRG